MPDQVDSFIFSIEQRRTMKHKALYNLFKVIHFMYVGDNMTQDLEFTLLITALY